MMEFGEWMNQRHKEIKDGYKAEKEETIYNTRQEMLTAMMEDMNRMLTDCDTVHPADPVHPVDTVYTQYTQAPLYNNNVNEEEWALYTAMNVQRKDK